MKMRKYFGLENNKNATYQYIWDIANTVLWENSLKIEKKKGWTLRNEIPSEKERKNCIINPMKEEGRKIF